MLESRLIKIMCPSLSVNQLTDRNAGKIVSFSYHHPPVSSLCSMYQLLSFNIALFFLSQIFLLTFRKKLAKIYPQLSISIQQKRNRSWNAKGSIKPIRRVPNG